MVDLLTDVLTFIYAPILVIVIGIIFYYVLKRTIKKILKIKVGKYDVSNRRQKTLTKLFQNTAKCIIFIIVILTILSINGIDTNTVLASLGVISVVLGLAFQDILKDLLSGIFILVEGNYTIGDTVEISNFKGEIIEIGLKTTKVKADTGEIKIFANRNISEVINYSLFDSLAVVDIKISIEEDTKETEKTLENIVKKINNKFEKTTGEAKLLGIQELDNTTIIYRITVPTKPNEKANMQRKILKEVKIVFDQNKEVKNEKL